jgi:hypothetical protein
MVPSYPVRTCRLRQSRAGGPVELATDELAIGGATQFPLRHEILEDDLTRAAAEAKQPRCLIHVQRKARHLSKRPENHVYELGSARLSRGSSSLILPAVLRSFLFSHRMRSMYRFGDVQSGN